MSRRKQENPQPRKRLVNSSDEGSSIGITTTATEAIDGREEIDLGEGEEVERIDSEETCDHENMYSCSDILTCGQCQREFALSDILKFINHKIVSSSKGTCRPFNKNLDENEDGAMDSVDLDGEGLKDENKEDENVDPATNSTGGGGVKKQTPSIISCSQRQKLKYLQGKGKSQLCKHSQKNQHHQHRCCGQPVKRSSDSSPSSPGVKQTVDAHTNTINTEPPSLTCRTCKQVFHSCWLLLQHAQSVHGSHLYIENSSNEPSTLPPVDGQAPGVPSIGGSLPSGVHSSSSINSSSMAATHPALSLLRMPPQDRQFPASFLAAAAAAAVSRPLGGSGPSHSDLFSASPSSVLNPVASLFAENLFSAAAASETQSGRAGTPARCMTGATSVAPPSGHQSSSMSAFEPHIDFYSQRLRQLAGATSPGSARTSVSPVRKLTPPSFPSTVSSAVAITISNTSTTTTTTSTCDIQSNNRGGASSQQSQQQQQQQQQQSHQSQQHPQQLQHQSQQQQPSSPKHKACEFCGKTFRFMSNLIVHRRSHTGEKPYKCNICNHACTQASKLKRHMKTHYRASQTAQNINSVVSENTTDSTQSQPESSAGGTPTSGVNNNTATGTTTTNGGDIDMEEDDLDDEDEDEEEEDLGDEEREEEEPGDGENSRNSSIEMVAEDLSTGGMGASSKKGASNGTSSKSKQCSRGNTPGGATAVQSLIGEVMENIGLSGIQQYNEAYKQALEEQVKVGPVGSSGGNNNGSSRAGVKQERPSSSSSHISCTAENGGNVNNLFKHQSPLLSHSNLTDFVGPLGANMNPIGNSLGGTPGSLISSAFDHHNPFDPKRLKLDLIPPPSEQRDALYAGLWLPAVANPFTASFAHLTSGSDASSALQVAELARNKVISESAFNKTSSISANSSPRAGPSLGRGSTPPSANRASPSGPTSGTPPSTNLTATPGRKEGGTRTRNDTCEYCGKVFKNCSNLTVHRRSHTGEKPYKCELCSYACAQSSKLTRHMKTHGRLGKDVYRCRFCEMPFSVPSTLEKHMRKCVVNQNNNAAGIGGVSANNSSSSNLQLIPCLTSNTSNSNDQGSDT